MRVKCQLRDAGLSGRLAFSCGLCVCACPSPVTTEDDTDTDHLTVMGDSEQYVLEHVV